MTPAQFCAVLDEATTPSWDVISVVVPSRDGVPERQVFAYVVEQYKREEVKTVILHKAAA